MEYVSLSELRQRKPRTIDEFFEIREKIRMLEEARQKGIHDDATAVETARRKGREEGRQEARAEKAREVARYLLAHGVLTDLPVADVEAIRRDIP